MNDSCFSCCDLLNLIFEAFVSHSGYPIFCSVPIKYRDKATHNLFLPNPFQSPCSLRCHTAVTDALYQHGHVRRCCKHAARGTCTRVLEACCRSSVNFWQLKNPAEMADRPAVCLRWHVLHFVPVLVQDTVAPSL